MSRPVVAPDRSGGLAPRSRSCACWSVWAARTPLPALPGKEFPPFGAPGDAGFRDICPAGQYLVGFGVRSGKWIDQLAIICAELRVDGTTGQQWRGPPRGGNGGSAYDKTCGPNEIVTGVAFLMTSKNRQVRELDFHCDSMTSPAIQYNLIIGNQATVFPNINQFCPSGEAVVGVQGRYGKHVNAVGVICDRIREIVVQPPRPVECGRGDEVPQMGRDACCPQPSSKAALRAGAQMVKCARRRGAEEGQ